MKKTSNKIYLLNYVNVALDPQGNKGKLTVIPM